MSQLKQKPQAVANPMAGLDPLVPSIFHQGKEAALKGLSLRDNPFGEYKTNRINIPWRESRSWALGHDFGRTGGFAGMRHEYSEGE